MECAFSFFCLAGVLVFIISSATRSQLRSDNWNRSYIAIAKKYGGQCNPAGWFGRPSARFRYGEAHCFLSTVKTKVAGGGEFTQLSISWPHTDLRLEIIPRWRATKLWPLSGMSEVITGFEQFDERFLVRANDSELSRAFLSEGVRWQISRLCSFLASNDVYIMVNRGSLVVKKPSYIRTQQVLDDFVRFILELFDQAMLTRTVGIDFVQEPSSKVVDEIKCLVCGEEIQSDLVTCIRCRTPHCKECWEYNGSCATYACGETRYVLPSVANPVDD